MPSNKPDYQANYIRKHYRENKKYYLDKAAERRIALLAEVRGLKKKCSRCPESDHRCLDFHHLDAKMKTASISNMVKNGCSMKKILKEIAKCIVLCANCHRKETLAP
jgi:hypothetical protein